MDEDELAGHLRRQDGVVSRAQVLAVGGDDVLVERRVRRREWARVHPGVYVDHTGPLSWRQRAWAATLLHAPAALAGASALRAHGVGTGSDDDVVELVVDRSRRVVDPPGVRTHQVRDLAEVAHLHLSPPRVRVEHAVLSVASAARTDDAAVAAVGDAVQQRATTAQRLLDALDARPRLARRRVLREVLLDVAAGALSALERRYLRDVERAHGLPRGERQSRAADHAAYRDVLHREQGVVVELDGRVGHTTHRDVGADLDRDLAASVDGLVTLRAGWSQVLSPCRLARQVGQVLAARGWTGQVRQCGPTCSVPTYDDGRGSSAPGAGDARPSVA